MDILIKITETSTSENAAIPIRKCKKVIATKTGPIKDVRRKKMIDKIAGPIK